MLALLRTFSWQDLRHHPWRSATAVVAVALGVALAYAVALINTSALDEFAAATRALDGAPDLSVRSADGRLDEAVFATVAADPRVALASPVLELTTWADDARGRRVNLRVLGVDALVAAALAPQLRPELPPGGGSQTSEHLFAPDTVFLNPAARQPLAGAADAAGALRVFDGKRLRPLRIGGAVGAPGPALAVMDIGAAQDAFGRGGTLSRIDLRLREGEDARAFAASFPWPRGVRAERPDDAQGRAGALSRAYRVNLSVLALVALFTGAFLVFSVLTLAVARRAPQFALLGVLGLTPAERLRLVLAESLLIGLAGSAAGLALGAGQAALALRALGGDLGGGFFAGVAPALRIEAGPTLLYGALGVAAALLGGWWPARAAQRMAPAQALKGLGGAWAAPGQLHRFAPWVLMALAAALAFAPPVAGLPLAAYLSVALGLLGGILVLPLLVGWTYDPLAPWFGRRALPMLAFERARHERATAAVAVSGVVAALALSVALTVMVASFRDSVAHWLDTVLPADLYLRMASAGGGSPAELPAAWVQAAAQTPGVARLRTQQVRSVQLAGAQLPLALITRELPNAARELPLVQGPLPVPAGMTAVWVSEAVPELYGVRLGGAFPALAEVFPPYPSANRSGSAQFFIAGIWRDYARQNGAVLIDAGSARALGAPPAVTDLALWLAPGAEPTAVGDALRAAVTAAGGSGEALDIASSAEIRATSLRIFDRSFAVTAWLQAVAIVIGLFGVAASFGAQVLARRKEFGLLAHLGLTRRQIGAVIAGEGLAWTAVGALAGLLLGAAVALVLVKVVNPQSFHWTMDLATPWLRLLGLCAAVVACGTAAAWAAARSATAQSAVRAVREDW